MLKQYLPNETSSLITDKSKELAIKLAEKKRIDEAISLLKNEKSFIKRHPYLSFSLLLSTLVSVGSLFGLKATGDNQIAVNRQYNETQTPNGKTCESELPTPNVCKINSENSDEQIADFCKQLAEELWNQIQADKDWFTTFQVLLHVSVLTAWGLSVYTAFLYSNEKKEIPPSVKKLFESDSIDEKTTRAQIIPILEKRSAALQSEIDALKALNADLQSSYSYPVQFLFNQGSKAMSYMRGKIFTPSIENTPKGP